MWWTETKQTSNFTDAFIGIGRVFQELNHHQNHLIIKITLLGFWANPC